MTTERVVQLEILLRARAQARREDAQVAEEADQSHQAAAYRGMARGLEQGADQFSRLLAENAPRRLARGSRMSITIPLPWPKPPLTQNDRNDRRTGGARKIKAALEQARWAIRAAKVPPLAGAEVDVHWRIPTKGRRDSDNLAPTLKVCQDALVQEGVLPDDSWVCVPRSGQAIHPPTAEPAAMWLELTNVTPMETP